MKYIEQVCPNDFMLDKNVSKLVKETLYWVCHEEYDTNLFFGKDELFPISQSSAYRNVVAYLKEAVASHKKIVISGDFDCDGICATTLMVMGLEMLGVSAGFYVPNRNKDGYGLSPKLVELYAQKGYEVIICVDNGVIAHEALALAKDKKIDVVILDHHEMDEQTKEYPYVLHPLLMEEAYHYLCGSGVVFEVLRSLASVNGYMLSLAALAAISDMMVLWGENRFVVRLGLAAMAKEKGTPLWYLMEGEELDESALALKLAPKINAVGRMFSKANPNQLVRYLLSSEVTLLSQTASQIIALNEERKELSRDILSEADKQVDADSPFIMAVGEYHEGIVGLVASNLVHSYQKPTFVLSEQEGVLKGSCRSVYSIDLVDMLRPCPYLDVFGGHKAAGGLSLKKSNLEAFKSYVEDYMNTHPLLEESRTYIPLTPAEFNLSNVEELAHLRPFLRVQEEPLYLLKDLELNKATYLSGSKHARWNLENGSEVLYFQIPNELKTHEKINVVGSLKVSIYRGKKKAVLMVKDYLSNN